MPPPTLKIISHAKSKKMPSIEELLAQKAKMDEEVQKKEVEEKERVEEKQKAEEAEEKQKVDAKWRAEEAEEKKKKEEKDRAAKALANRVVADVEELQRTKGVQMPATSKAVVP